LPAADADKAEKEAGEQTARPMTGKITPKDQEICNENNVCKWHAITVRRLQTWGRLQGMPAVCSKLPVGRGMEEKRLSFSAVSSEKEDENSPNSKSSGGRPGDGLLVDLLNDFCELTGAGLSNTESTSRGEAFHGQFGAFGLFAIKEVTRITEEAEQIIYTEHTIRVDEVPIALARMLLPCLRNMPTRFWKRWNGSFNPR
jgi:hypothetical protein